MNAPPTAAEIVADPARARDLAATAAPAILAQLAAAQSAIAARLATEPINADDRLLTVDEAAAALHVSPDWLYRSDAARPLRVPLSAGVIRFSSKAIQRMIERQRGK